MFFDFFKEIPTAIKSTAFSKTEVFGMFLFSVLISCVTYYNNALVKGVGSLMEVFTWLNITMLVPPDLLERYSKAPLIIAWLTIAVIVFLMYLSTINVASGLKRFVRAEVASVSDGSNESKKLHADLMLFRIEITTTFIIFVALGLMFVNTLAVRFSNILAVWMGSYGHADSLLSPLITVFGAALFWFLYTFLFQTIKKAFLYEEEEIQAIEEHNATLDSDIIEGNE